MNSGNDDDASKQPKRPTPVKALEALARGRAIRAEQRRAEAEAKVKATQMKEVAVATYGNGPPTANNVNGPPNGPPPVQPSAPVATPVVGLEPHYEDLKRRMQERFEELAKQYEERLKPIKPKVSKKKRVVVDDSSESS